MRRERTQNTHCKPQHGDAANEELVLLGEPNPPGGAKDAILNLRLLRLHLRQQHQQP